MIKYLVYRAGHFIACVLPLRAAYAFACFVADTYSFLAPKERAAVVKNLKVILGADMDEKELNKMSREVFRNFAKYLVDFFRFSKVDDRYMKKFVKVEGRENIDAALARGKGAIMLSAHIGNWELGGAAVPMIGYPLSAVVLTHKDERVNNFFRRQRMMCNVNPIEFGISLRSCYKVLRGNGLLALLGDRDFSNNGISVDFFGKKAVIPRGPATFSFRLGSAMVPSLMMREKDDTFRLIFEKPIFLEPGATEEEAIPLLTKNYLAVLEKYIRNYPTQWYVFKEMWSNR